jgi:hypothetical protein
MAVTSSFSLRVGEDTPIDLCVVPTVNIKGWELVFVAAVAGGAGSAAASLRYTTAPSISITDGPAGQLRVVIASADTAALPVGLYAWEVRRVDSGYDQTQAEGVFYLLPSPSYIPPPSPPCPGRRPRDCGGGWAGGWWPGGYFEL